MEIEIKNFGPISYLKFDIDKDLHLIYGKNAVGKSYATYCIYCLLKNLSSENGYKYESSKKWTIYKNELVEKLLIGGRGIDIVDFFKGEVQDSISNILSVSVKNSFQNTFSSFQNLTNQYSKLDYEITIYFDKEAVINICQNEGNELEVRFAFKKYIETRIHRVEEEEKEVYKLEYFDGKEGVGQIFTTTNLNDIDGYINAEVRDILYNLNFEFRDIYYLPASRSGLYQALNSFTPIIAELTQNRFFLKNKSIELPSLSEPLADYFIDLSTLNKDRKNDEFDEIIAFLEDDILKGKVDYNEDTKRIMYQPYDTNLKLNLSEASSMVSELSPLVIYFKHIINNKYYSDLRYGISKSVVPKETKDIIFIEEPEAHLHPEIQVKLMELFVKLTKLNLKIFITSHSNYMFNKLNNLIISGEMDYKNVMVYHLVHTDKGSVNDFEMTPTKEGMNDENFQDVSEQLYYERMKFLEEND